MHIALLGIFKRFKFDLSFWFGLALTFLISTPMIFEPGYIAFTDFVHGPHFQYNWQVGQVLINGLRYFFDYISPAFSSRVFLPLSILLIYFSARYFVRSFTKDGLIAIAVSSFAVLNLFVYDRVLYGQVGVVWAYASLFVFTAAVLKILNLDGYRTSAKYILMGGIALGLAIDSSSHSIFIFTFLAGLFWIFYNFKNKSYGYFIYSTVAFGVMFVTGFLMNSFWIYNALTHKTAIGGFVSQQISEKDLIAFQTSGNSFVGKLGNTALLSGFWGKDQQRYLDISSVPFWWFGYIPFMILFVHGLYVLYKKGRYLFWMVLVGVMLTLILSVATSNPLLIKIYNIVPYYLGMREPQKWVMSILVFYSFVFIHSLIYLKERLHSNIPTYTLLIILMLLHFRFFLSFFGQVQTFEFPKSWEWLDRYLSSNILQIDGSCKNKTLSLPWHMYTSYPFSKKITANLASVYFTCPMVIGTNMEWGGIYDNSVEGSRDEYGEWLSGDKNFPPPKDIQFVVLFKTVDWQKYSWLITNNYLEKLEENEDWVLYKTLYITNSSHE